MLLVVDHDAFDALVAASDTAMIVVTAADGDERSGCLVGFHTQSSIEPRRYAIWISKANHTLAVAQRASHLAVHFLDARDEALAELFGGETGDEVDKFSAVAWEPGPGGVPMLTDCPSRVVLRRVATEDLGGDHICFECEPVEAWDRDDYRPLRYTSVKDIDPGHEAD
jgi:flavin reductase (DIM6/NTAB) family NADH-FMN oxidoreductase RutF